MYTASKKNKEASGLAVNFGNIKDDFCHTVTKTKMSYI